MVSELLGISNRTKPPKDLTVLKNLEDIYELSPLQQDNLRRYLESPGQGLFHENLLFHFEGTIDTDVFIKCWERILERHTILRTSFFHRGSQKPVQVVHRNVRLPLEIIDWRDTGLVEQDQIFASLLDADRAIDYQLQEAPLMRLSLIFKSDNQFSMWWRFHHMLMDGWAFTIVLWDFLNLYRYYIQGQKDLEILPGYPYKEYINYLRDRNTAGEEAFWPEYLKDFTPQKQLVRLKVPDSGTVATQIRQGRIDYPIEELYQPLQKLIKPHEITLNSVFQGVFTLLMSHYCDGELDMVTGQTVADRPLSLENSHARVGLHVNTLPIRYRIQPEDSFVHWAKGLQTSMMNTFQYSASSEQDIKRWCGIPEGESIFHSALVFKNIPLADDPAKGLSFRMTGYSLESRPHFPLSVFVWPNENMELKIIYDNRRYLEESALEILENLKKGVEKLIEKPDISVSAMMNF